MQTAKTKALDKIEKSLNQDLIWSDSSWEVYREPFLNGERPDFVCLNPSKGILIIKYLNFSQNNYDIEKDRFIDIKTNNFVNIQNPISYFDRLQSSIRELYLPRLGEKAFAFRAITSCIIFNEERDKSLDLLSRFSNFNKFIDKKNQFTLGCLNNLKLTDIFPNHQQDLSKLMSEELAMDFRNWLYKPDFAEDQQTTVALPKRQWDLIHTSPKSKYRRIKGSAGSGKSFVLCGRAVELAKENKKVLIVTYNITLINYLRELCDRFHTNAQNHIEFIHFHEWMSKTFDFLGISIKYPKFDEQEEKMKNYLEIELPNQLIQALEATPFIEKYDAILVDEGQDFNRQWWNTLQQSLKENGEMLLVADTAQDIYIRQLNSWIDDPMKNLGMASRWTELNDSFRIPNNVKPLLNKFQKEFFESKNINLIVSKQDDLMDCQVKWIDTDPDSSIQKCVDELLVLVKEDQNQKRSFTDLTFLTDNQLAGLKVVEKLRASDKSLKVVDTFKRNEKDRNQKIRKIAFTKLDATVKATTIHSFKGWESRMIVILITRAKTPKDLSVIYTGLTRIKQHPLSSFLTILNTTKRLNNYLVS